MTRGSSKAYGCLAVFVACGCSGDRFTADSSAGGTPGKGGGSSGGVDPAGGAASGGRTSSGGIMSGSGGAISGGSPAAGGLPVAGAPPTGGVGGVAGTPPSGGFAGVAGAPAMGGFAGSTGATGPCVTTMDCQACCDETYPNVHGEFASTMSACACENCYDTCANTLCNTIYDWTQACLACIHAQTQEGCLSASQICDDSSTCQPYAACVYSCL